MDTKILQELGLSKNEVEVYLRLLELGPSTAVEIAKISKLHRPNIYDAINKLVKKSLVSQFKRDKTYQYEACDPEQLLTILRAKEGELQALIPELKVKQLLAKPKSNVTIFEGIAGARKALKDILNSTKKEFFVLGAPKDYAVQLGEGWINAWHKERITKKIIFHHIVNEDYYKHRIALLRKMKYTTIKFLPKEYNSPQSLFIYDKGVLLGFINPFMHIRIINEDTAKSFKNYYKMLEKIAEDKAPQEIGK